MHIYCHFGYNAPLFLGVNVPQVRLSGSGFKLLPSQIGPDRGQETPD